MSGKRTITPETEAAVVAAYGSGKRSSEVAKEFGINRKTVTTIVRRNGAEVLAQRIASGRRPMDTTPLHPKIAELREQGWSQQKIANEVGISQTVVSRALAKMGVPTKDTRTGVQHPSWRGGRSVTGSGYILVYVEQVDPMASMRNRMGYVLEHRLVMARALGRPLSKSETVHHVNGDRADNRLGNLQLRQGRHGKGIVLVCVDCGSHNVAPANLKETPMYHCGECLTEVRIVDALPVHDCECDAPIVANASVELRGVGGVR